MNTRKLENLYMKLTVKSPLTVSILIIVGLGFIFYLFITTNTNVYKTYQGVISISDDENVYINILLNEEMASYFNKGQLFYWYIARDNAIYKESNFSLVKKSNKLQVSIKVDEKHKGILLRKNNYNIKVDFIVDKISLWDRLIGKDRVRNE